jgi:Holliday junction resolvase RusA-like endonuclease
VSKLLRFFVDGMPLPQGSHRAIMVGRHPKIVDQQDMTRRNAKGEITRKSGSLQRWRQAVAEEAASAVSAAGQGILYGWVQVGLSFFFERPKSHYNRSGELSSTGKKCAHPLKYDLSKLQRAVEDALTGNAIRDDAYIVEINATKSWGERCGVLVGIREVG